MCDQTEDNSARNKTQGPDYVTREELRAAFPQYAAREELRAQSDEWARDQRKSAINSPSYQRDQRGHNRAMSAVCGLLAEDAPATAMLGHLDEIAQRIHSTCNTIDFTTQNLGNLGDRIFGPSPSDLRDSVTQGIGIDTNPSIDKIFVALGRLDMMARDLEATATRLYGLA